MVRHSFWSVSILWNWPTPNRVLEPLLHGTNMFCQDNHQSSLYFHVPDKLNFQTSSTGIAAVLVAVCTRQSVETPCKGGSLMLRFFWSYLWPAVLSHATKICANHIAWGHAYSWIADQRHAHKKSICQRTRRVTTLSRPPLESSRRGESRSFRSIFV